MATNLVRYELDGAPHWGVASASGIAPLVGGYPTTAALIDRRGPAPIRFPMLFE